jgi:hypothetical protein
MATTGNFKQAPLRLTQRLAAAARGKSQLADASRGGSQAKAPSSSRGRDVTLAVTRGRHAGAEAEVMNGRVTIGASLDGDIVLTDRGIAAQHLIVDLVGKPGARSLTLSALAPGVLVGGEELGVGIQFADPSPADRTSLSVITALPLAVAAGIGAGALGTWATSSSPSLPPLAPQSRTYAGPSAAPAGLPRAGTIALADAAKTMERQLAAAGLDKQIKISQRDNVLTADGAVPMDAFPKWRAIKIALRDSVSERVLIADMVKPVETSDGPRAMIAAVNGGKSPSVTGVNGKRAGIGETLGDGWIVREITSEVVQLERGGSRVTVKLTP